MRQPPGRTRRSGACTADSADRHRDRPVAGWTQNSPSEVLHSEVVLANGDGGYSTKMTQTGTVDEITLSSIVVRSADGYTQIYVFPSAAVMPARNVAPNDALTGAG